MARTDPVKPAETFSWYIPEKYSGVEHFTAMEWWNVLSYRRMAIEGTDEVLAGAFRAIKQDPLAMRGYPGLAVAPIQDLTLVDSWRLSRFAALPPIAKWIDDWLKKYGSVPEEEYGVHMYFRGAPKLLSLHDELVQMSNDLSPSAGRLLRNPFVSVDLEAPDNILIEEFGAWLKKKRVDMNDAGCSLETTIGRRTGGLKRFTKPMLEAWVNTGVLPYLDITIACRFYGVPEPTNSELSAMLLQDLRRKSNRGGPPKQRYVALDDKIRKQTKVHAEQLMEVGALGALYRQGIAEWKRAHGL